MNWTWIAMPLLCAALGYVTNWLAIKMLFRPHKQKFLFGMKMPFTPGLLHKERFRISKKIGETLSKSVLTHEVLVRALTSPEITEKISLAADDFLRTIESDERTLGEVGAALFGVEKDEMVEKAQVALNEVLVKFSAEGGSFEVVKHKIAGHIKHAIESRVSLDKTASEMLPQSVVEWVIAPVEPRIPRIVEYMKQALENNPSVGETLSALVGKIAREQFGSFMGLFIKYDELYIKIKDSFFDYIEDEENRADIAEKIDAVIQKAMTTPVGEFVAKMPQSAELSENFMGSLDEQINNALNGVLEKIQAKLVEFSEEMLLRAENVPVNRLFGYVSRNGENRDKIKAFMVKAATMALEKGGTYAISSLDISKLIESQLNGFNVAETEEMLMGVVGRELKWIMVLGGIIGFIVGFVPVIFSALGA